MIRQLSQQQLARIITRTLHGQLCYLYIAPRPTNDPACQPPVTSHLPFKALRTSFAHPLPPTASKRVDDLVIDCANNRKFMILIFAIIHQLYLNFMSRAYAVV